MKKTQITALPAIIICAVIIAFISMSFFPEKACARPGVSIDVREADIKDVLTALAMKDDRNIIFVGESTEVSLQLQDVSVMDALELLLEKTGMTYVQEDNLIVVGSEDKLQEDFFNRMSITRFQLSFITTEQLEPLIDELNIPLQRFTVEENLETIWVQGTPRSLAKLRELLGTVDQPEYAKEEELKKFQLEHIAADQLEPFIAQFDIPLQSFTMKKDTKAIWVQGTSRSFDKLREILDVIDQPEYAKEEKEVKKFQFDYILAKQLQPLIIEFDIQVQSFYMEETPETLWAQGTPQELSRLKELKDVVDTPENESKKADIKEDITIDYRQVELTHITPKRAVSMLADTGNSINNYVILGNRLLIFDDDLIDRWEAVEQVIQDIDHEDAREQHVFIYKLENIVAQEALELLDSFNLEGVTIKTFDLPEYGNEILILCPPEMENKVYRSLDSIDSDREKIKAPIDSATGENAREELNARRKLLSELSGASEQEMVISDNISGDDNDPYHVLWVESTPGMITRLEQLLEDF